MIEDKGEKIFKVVNYILLSIVGIVALYPFIYVLSASLSSPDAVTTGKVVFLPQNITFASYKKVLSENGIWMAYGNTIYYTVIGTAFNLLLTVCGAYPLSKKYLRGGRAISFMVALTMWFNAGIIPFYLNLRNMHMLNTRIAIIVAFGCSAFNVILLRTFFQGIPDSLEEAAKIDGANDLQILSKVYLPLSKPALATIGLFYGVGRWNGYFWTMVILKDEDKIPLQVLLKKLIVESSMSEEFTTALDFASKCSKETIIYTTIIVSLIPVIIVFPYIQKYFVKGIMVGSIKG